MSTPSVTWPGSERPHLAGVPAWLTAALATRAPVTGPVEGLCTASQSVSAETPRAIAWDVSARTVMPLSCDSARQHRPESSQRGRIRGLWRA
jgi:hypothetical protein